MIIFHPYVIIFKMTPPRVILKKSLLTDFRKVKNELLLVHHKSRSSSSLRLPQLLFHFWSHIAIAPRSPVLCTSSANSTVRYSNRFVFFHRFGERSHSHSSSQSMYSRRLAILLSNLLCNSTQLQSKKERRKNSITDHRVIARAKAHNCSPSHSLQSINRTAAAISISTLP
jgi:hypothetical protein